MRLQEAHEGPTHSAVAAAGTVHDLGNLIQIATAAINIVARTPDMPAAHAGPMLDRARSSLEHAGAIVRQSIDRIRDQALMVDAVDLDECLADVAALVEAMRETGLVLAIDIEPGLHAVRCDRLGLQSAVLNLVFNARDAMAGNGVVAVHARAIANGRAAPGVELRVTDTGVGMSLATVSRAFEPFFTTKSEGLGGVGLPMVERFVREAGGEILIESELGVGTVVTMRLPATTRTNTLSEE